MPNKLKQILSGFMIAGDVLLLIVFLLMFLEGSETGLSLFMIIFLSIDAYLSADYISSLHKNSSYLTMRQEAAMRRRIKAEMEREQRQKEDQEMAENIRKNVEAKNNLEPEDLQDLLQKDYGDHIKTSQHS